MYKKISLIIFTLFFGVNIAKSQVDLGTFITTGGEDASKLINGYASPMLRAIGNNFNAGWYNSAEPLKPGHFDFRLIPSASFIPDFDRNFNVEALRLSHVEILNSDVLPTMFGSTGSYEILLHAQDGSTTLETSGELEIPAMGINLWPGITPQFSIGIFKGTEFMFRYLPPLSLRIVDELEKPLKTNYFGIGAKHDVLQWIMDDSDNSPLDFSIAAAWFKTRVLLAGPFLTVSQVDDIYNGEILTDFEVDADSQEASFETTGFRLDLLVSRKSEFLTIYGGLGYSHSTTGFKILGDFPFVDYDSQEEVWVGKSLTDPINVEEAVSHLELSGGITIHAAIFSLNLGGAYSPTGYSTVHVGLGIGFLN